ncbi:NAD(P)-dependent alcohol dehydrogenase, partial [Candidatus Aerophobetes bacterium]
MKITAMYLEKPGKIISRKIDMPEIKKDEVLVKIKAVGVCGSDVHYYDKGKIGSFIVKRPLILGHECSGEIVEVGEEVKNLQIGDKVALEPGIPCRRCIYCKTGRYNLCPEIRFMATPPVNGAFVEYVAHPADFVFKLPENVSYEEATLFEPLAVGLYSVVRAKVGFGGKILILGAGPIGLSTLQAAINIGGGRITVADIYDFRLEKAKELGA